MNFRENGRGGWLFSDEIELSFDIEGLGVRRYLANKVKYSNSIKPRIIKMVDDTGVKLKAEGRQEIGFYASSEGSFACKPSIINGQRHCDVAALIHDENESCFIKGNSAFCHKMDKTHTFDKMPRHRENRYGKDANAETTEPYITKPYTGNRTNGVPRNSRQKRQIRQVTSGARVIQIAFYLDQAFIERFYLRNPSDDAAAEEDARMYTIMLANEMTYRLQALKDRQLSYRGGILELAVNPTAIIYPVKGQDLPFIEKNGTFMLNATLDNLKTYVAANPPDVPFHHAMLLSGLELYKGDDILGQARYSAICSPSLSRFSYSVNEDRSFDVLLTMVHELGHALGAFHDQNLFGPCTPGRWIMSAFLDFPDQSSRDTYTQFSPCSAEDIRDHLSRQPDCLARPTDDDFLENFCKGPRGFRGSNLDYQCQLFYGCGPNCTECDGIDTVKPEQCWRFLTTFCYPGTGDFCYGLPYVADGTPCEGPLQDTSYYCYLGECVEEVDLCPDGPPATLPPAPPPPPCSCDNSITRITRYLCCLFNDCC